MAKKDKKIPKEDRIQGFTEKEQKTLEAQQDKYTVKYILKRYWREYLRFHKFKLFVCIGSLSVISGLMGAQIQMVRPLIDTLMQGEFDLNQILIFAGIFLAMGAAKGTAFYLQGLFSSSINANITRDLQIRFFSKIIRDDTETLEGNGTGDYVAKMHGGLSGLAGLAGTFFIAVPRQITIITSFFIVMIINSWELTVLTIIIFPAMLIPLSRIGKKIENISAGQQAELSKMSGGLDDSLRGARQIKSYNLFDFVTENMTNTFNLGYDLTHRHTKIVALVGPIVEVLAAFNIGAVMAFGGFLAIQGNITAGEFVTFLVALMTAYRPMKMLADTKVNLYSTKAEAAVIYDVLDSEPKIVDTESSKPLDFKNGHIELRDVSFDYATKSNILNNIGIDIPAGKSIALVGNSGGGKSTCLSLIARFYEVSKGGIFIDNQNIKDITLETLREHVALVTQETILFNTTIRQNIELGKIGATDQEIIEACKKAAAWEFVQQLPQGLDSAVGESGLQLSGGQRQRIAIARAFLKDAPILLLDEATSALDTVSERKIQATLEELAKGRTTITIAHRLSTIQNSDLIYVIDAGKVQEKGTHAELKAMNGVYQSLCQAQEL